MHTIEIDEDLMELLKREAEPFIDTPNTVLRRLLGVDVNAPTSPRVLRKGRRVRVSHRRSARKGTRASAGSILPESDYVEPLLATLKEKGGRAPAQEVIDSVGLKLDSRLTDLDRQRLSSGGIRWQNRVQFVRLKLIERGLLRRGSPKGVWELAGAEAGPMSSKAGARR